MNLLTLLIVKFHYEMTHDLNSAVAWRDDGKLETIDMVLENGECAQKYVKLGAKLHFYKTI